MNSINDVVKIKKYKVLLPWIFFFIACFLVIYLSIRLSYKNNPVNNPENKQAEVTEIIEAVGKLIILPEETPTVATITNLEKLKGQIFFQNAKVGDKILIYAKAQKAILYDPITNKIVEIAPFNTSASQGALTPDVKN